MTKERFSRYIETSCKHLSIQHVPEKTNQSNLLLQRPFNHGILCIVLLYTMNILLILIICHLRLHPRNPKPILPELLIHYLLLYNLSMISRYETDWWYDLLGSYSSEDYPFIYQFLSISAQKSLTIFQIFINGTKSISLKNTSQMTCVLVAWRRPTLTGTRSQLPSALESLTSVFGMGTGVTSAIITKLLKAYSFKTR